jgi:CheY-like chemotaxis protein
MENHTFVAESAADALAQIREKLGPEAVVLNVRRLPASGFSRLWQKPRIEVLAHLPEKKDSEDLQAFLPDAIAPCGAETARALPKSLPEYSGFSDLENPSGEAETAPGGRGRRWRIRRLLQETGLLPIYADSVLEEVRSRFGEIPPDSIAKEIDLVRGVLASLWKSTEPESPAANMHVFLGVPGSGKTTCLCKWLARVVLREGAVPRVWRLDAHVANTAESLSIYCEILGVQIERFLAETSASSTLTFIDLPGANPTDLEALKTMARLIRETRLDVVADESFTTRESLEQLIARRSDITLLTAVNGTLGVAVARTAQPTVILMDIHLPGISGIDALKILREDPATAHIPVVALSANAMPHNIATGLEAGFFRYLTKPIKVKEFMDTLNVALEYAEKGKP